MIPRICLSAKINFHLPTSINSRCRCWLCYLLSLLSYVWEESFQGKEGWRAGHLDQKWPQWVLTGRLHLHNRTAPDGFAFPDPNPSYLPSAWQPKAPVPLWSSQQWASSLLGFKSHTSVLRCIIKSPWVVYHQLSWQREVMGMHNCYTCLTEPHGKAQRLVAKLEAENAEPRPELLLEVLTKCLGKQGRCT